MTAQTSSSPTPKPEEEHKQSKSAQVVQTVEKDIKPATTFFTKFSNDWVMNFAAGLAYNILTAIVPIVIAIVSITGLVVGQLDPAARTLLISRISNIFPSTLSSNGQNVLAPVLISLSKDAGFLGIIALLLALFGGSRLFVTLEGYFDVIYHTVSRNAIRQNIMAVIMMLIFVVLVPLMVFAGSGPDLAFSLLKTTPLGHGPVSDLLLGLGSFIAGIISAWILFLAIYIVVPNQRISFRNSWLGALVAAVLVQLYLTLFPLYVTHFLNNYTGSAGAAGFAIILLLFLYYFAVILLLGAEINAYFAEGVRATPENIPAMVHRLTSHLPTSEPEVKEQATPSHKDEEPKKIFSKSKAEQLEAQAKTGGTENGKDQSTQQTQPTPTNHQRKGNKKKDSSQKSSSRPTLATLVAGVVLTFLLELFRQRQGQGEKNTR
jgi:membrane protein